KLSSERAISVLARFEERAKLHSSKLVATGYGKERPLTTNDTEENMAKNRRVEILIVRQQEQGNSEEIDDLMKQYFGNQSLDFDSNDL
ncbi:MAG: OmpA family protein, partial [Oscillospiraceae bacterium]